MMNKQPHQSFDSIISLEGNTPFLNIQNIAILLPLK